MEDIVKKKKICPKCGSFMCEHIDKKKSKNKKKIYVTWICICGNTVDENDAKP